VEDLVCYFRETSVNFLQDVTTNVLNILFHVHGSVHH
jgi:hypothetical protein